MSGAGRRWEWGGVGVGGWWQGGRAGANPPPHPSPNAETRSTPARLSKLAWTDDAAALVVEARAVKRDGSSKRLLPDDQVGGRVGWVASWGGVGHATRALVALGGGRGSLHRARAVSTHPPTRALPLPGPCSAIT